MPKDMKKTLVLGATPNPSRTAYTAVHMLKTYNHPIVPVGIKQGEVGGMPIINSKDIQPEVDTITMYIGASNQKEWYDYILGTKPKRIIFNPGAENPELEQLAAEKGIKTENACTLVMLRSGQY